MDIQNFRQIDPKIILVGNHPGIIQSILDYDFLIGRPTPEGGKQSATPSIIGIVANGKRYERFFYGRREILIPLHSSLSQIPKELKNSANMFVNVTSGRRVLQSTIEVLDFFPNLKLGTVFAENVPEKHSIDLSEYAKTKNVTLIGPASVGMVVPGSFKLGAIGGISSKQILTSGILSYGGVCVLSASGGMVNEIINIVGQTQNKISFALSFGGDRFPLTEPVDAFIYAQKDENTKAIIYYGELGGEDEYKIAKLLEVGHITKPVICYIGGVVSDLFETPPQFGHAKAMAENRDEGAKEKRYILKKSGAKVSESFYEFVEMIKSLDDFGSESFSVTIEDMEDRRHALIASSISKDVDGDIKIMGEDLLDFARQNSFAKIVASLFLGQKIKSKDTEDLVDFILRISVDHGPYVSGALNTIVAARAGKDLVSSLSSGLLTIGPRFGGALNEAARGWLFGVIDNKNASQFVEEAALKKEYIQGIGHKKYRIDMPDPRVEEVKKYTEKLEKKRFLDFALEVEKITTQKKGNLILNIDGVIAAVMLDFLSEKEEYSDAQLQDLVKQEFFNSIFVLSRSVGFISHFLDQKRLDEGLLRLSEEDVADASV